VRSFPHQVRKRVREKGITITARSRIINEHCRPFISRYSGQPSWHLSFSAAGSAADGHGTGKASPESSVSWSMAPVVVRDSPYLKRSSRQSFWPGYPSDDHQAMTSCDAGHQPVVLIEEFQRLIQHRVLI